MEQRIVTAAQMKAIERSANEAGLLYIQMMENAGRAVYAELKRRLVARDDFYNDLTIQEAEEL